MLRKILSSIAPNFHPTRWSPLRRAFLYLVGWLRPEHLLTRYGFKLYIPKRDRSFYTFFLWRDRVYEPEISELTLQLLRPGDLVVDVGANIGYYACLFAKTVGPTGKVFAFEPEPTNFSVLEHNLELNNVSTCCTCLAKAISDSTGSTELYMSEENKGDHTLVPLAERQAIRINTSTFDDFVRIEIPERRIRLVKIDVQGHELKVLSGMRNSLIQNNVENLIVEFSPYRALANGETINMLLSLLD